jgi:hypothetical protein
MIPRNCRKKAAIAHRVRILGGGRALAIRGQAAGDAAPRGRERVPGDARGARQTGKKFLSVPRVQATLGRKQRVAATPNGQIGCFFRSGQKQHTSIDCSKT